MTGVALIHAGGWIFWSLLVAEFVVLCFLMNDEKPKGAYASASLLVTLALIFLFGDISLLGFKDWFLGRVIATVLIGVGYVAVGVPFSFFRMWPRFGKRRRLRYKNTIVRPWLENQNIDGDEVPPHLREEWGLVVFGNLDQEAVESKIRDARESYRNDVVAAQNDTYGSARRGDRYPADLTPEQEAAFVDIMVNKDPSTIEGVRLRRYVVEARHAWLKTQKAEVTDNLPDNLLGRWQKRLTLPYKRREGNKEWAELATEPLFRHNKGRLATWAAYWLPLLVWLGVHDVVINGWHNLVSLFEGWGQKIMRRQYAAVRADFEIPAEPVDPAATALLATANSKPKAAESSVV